jgi:putative hydrolase of the HAD superfamily
MDTKAATHIRPDFSWEDIDTVLLDMDGTLLDKHFDDYFWEQYVPEHYSLKHDISIEEAKKQLLSLYKSVENTLDWSNLDYWSDRLDMDMPDLKLRVNFLIGVHPYVTNFLQHCRFLEKTVILVTNAHSKTLQIKLDKTAIGGLFDHLVCSQEIGYAKEEPQFWAELVNRLQFDKQRSLLADDTEKVLRTAQEFGIGQLIFVARPSSRGPLNFSRDFPSIEYFRDLIL